MNIELLLAVGRHTAHVANEGLAVTFRCMPMLLTFQVPLVYGTSVHFDVTQLTLITLKRPNQVFEARKARASGTYQFLTLQVLAGGILISGVIIIVGEAKFAGVRFAIHVITLRFGCLKKQHVFNQSGDLKGRKKPDYFAGLDGRWRHSFRLKSFCPFV